MPSLSSASTTSHSPSPHAAPLPNSVMSPPMMNDGRRPASTRTSASIEDVVVLPWVPATATVRRVAVMAASTSARRSTGIPTSLAATTSGLPAGIAVDTATSSAPRRWDASWPTETSTPSDRRRSRAEESLRSLPLTWCPMATSTVAMALMPAPPTPTTWMRSGRERSSSGTGVLLGELGNGSRGSGTAQAAGRLGHGRQPILSASRGSSTSASSGPVSSASAMSRAAPADTRATALAVW